MSLLKPSSWRPTATPPEKNQMVLVYSLAHGVEFGVFDGAWWGIPVYGRDFYVREVTHWQPITTPDLGAEL